MKAGSVPKLPRRRRAQVGTCRSVTANIMVAQTTTAATISRWMLAALAAEKAAKNTHEAASTNWMSCVLRILAVNCPDSTCDLEKVAVGSGSAIEGRVRLSSSCVRSRDGLTRAASAASGKTAPVARVCQVERTLWASGL